jgi:hypothetical protein
VCGINPSCILKNPHVGLIIDLVTTGARSGLLNIDLTSQLIIEQLKEIENDQGNINAGQEKMENK